MSEAISALGGARFEGYVTVEEVGPVGMITLRGALGSPTLAKAVESVMGVEVPASRRIETAGTKSVAWMSPDELLLVLPYAEVTATQAALTAALGKDHALAVDVSDARAVFRIKGDKAREVLAKLCPVDLSPAVFHAGEVRRTRAAQVAAALWLSGGDEFTLVCFRSVAGYVMGLLRASASPGGEVGLF